MMTSNLQNELKKYRPLTQDEIALLRRHGCSAHEWDRVLVTDDTDLDIPHDVVFEGDIRIGALDRAKDAKLEKVRLVNVTLGDNVAIDRTSHIEFTPGARCGVGAEVGVLDETGSRPVRIFPGLSSHLATLIARDPEWASSRLKEDLDRHIDSIPVPHEIGEGSRIHCCGSLVNVSVGKGIVIEGAVNLRDGMIVNNIPEGKSLATIGNGVDAESFVIEDGALESGATVRNCYIGQGAVLEKGFSAHDSLFFANCSLENGEACALFGGPYTVSMHKSSLLIACQTSFMNAGSGTNQSNHMYKLGPSLWGVMERGVKTASSSYLMLGAKIGAFSLLMGQHKTHPDTSDFPFSYLFGDSRGATVVVPAVMLKSCGLVRDGNKWPSRDRRKPLSGKTNDLLVFDVLNPVTVDAMLNARLRIRNMLSMASDIDNFVRYRGMKFSRQSLARAFELYGIAISKYLSKSIGKYGEIEADTVANPEKWLDLGGIIMPRGYLERIFNDATVDGINSIVREAYDRYGELEREWIAARFTGSRLSDRERIESEAAEFDRLIEEDRKKALDDISSQNDMLKL